MTQVGSVRELVAKICWKQGVRLFQLGKRVRFLGPFQHAMLAATNKLLPPPSYEMRISLQDGLEMMVPPCLPRARTYAAGVYEEGVTAVVRSLLSEGDTFVDVGAFCGYYTLLSSRLVGMTGRVFSFEPLRSNYCYLVRNIRANSCWNVTAVNKAASSETGSRYLTIHEEPDHNWLSSSPPQGKSIEIASLSLDDFFRLEGWPPVNVVKIDVEGSETEVLEGMVELSRRNPSMRAIMEFDPANLRRAGARPCDLALQLVKLGFRSGSVIERGMTPFDVAKGMPRIIGTYNILFRRDED